MRSVELAVYADTLAAEAAELHARLERIRSRLRRAAIEREASEALPDNAVERLGRLGLLGTSDQAADTAELAATHLDIVAVERLQAWVEGQLAARAGREDGARREAVRGTFAADPTQPPHLGAAA